MGCAASASAKVAEVAVEQPKLDPNTLLGQYEVGKVVGKGAFAVCRSCTSRTTGEEVCVKTIKKSSPDFDIDLVWSEIECLKTIKHPGCIHFKHAITTKEAVHIVQEIALGGDLWDSIQARGALEESRARNLTGQLVSAVAYLHSQNICHRDIKPENVVMMGKYGTPEYDRIKLVDFGISSKSQSLDGYRSSMNALDGTPVFAAPELLKMMLPPRVSGFDRPTSYSAKVDIWACGGVVYTMLCGNPPFPFSGQGEDIAVLVQRIFKGDVQFQGQPWGSISLQAVEFIRALMAVDPTKRPTAAMIVHQPWLASPSDSTSTRATAHSIQNTKVPTGVSHAPALNVAKRDSSGNGHGQGAQQPRASVTDTVASSVDRRGRTMASSSKPKSRAPPTLPDEGSQGQRSRGLSADSMTSQRTTQPGASPRGPEFSSMQSTTSPESRASMASTPRDSKVRAVMGVEQMHPETKGLLMNIVASSAGGAPVRRPGQATEPPV
mmetsp:Transcript_17812/g.27532  ORF Transcript_17812/g.27532 Transcript_17812/m.27532 type:complete len:493 (-) Transcript_17812:47-1525(-)|eukprot:CAMPEP_0184300010 /NCGR_PEP_ID=MMETSP1049-20130417/10523_1 /TAXON_ID=77928 /ORGANISM="Proteomonas sulcata, Strain CCMP704" /LENGTH=492 /DNA_ID=CAMNT_0026610627 /DNA_START=300 /DNA_END=1778 /DNA_ORIENTATION=+